MHDYVVSAEKIKLGGTRLHRSNPQVKRANAAQRLPPCEAESDGPRGKGAGPGGTTRAYTKRGTGGKGARAGTVGFVPRGIVGLGGRPVSVMAAANLAASSSAAAAAAAATATVPSAHAATFFLAPAADKYYTTGHHTLGLSGGGGGDMMI